ncbi:MAG: Chaperone SurA [Gemmatimonadaceae bacterium]|nr:Chaperone SurA [Gemmatimonadaceae bacterium]
MSPFVRTWVVGAFLTVASLAHAQGGGLRNFPMDRIVAVVGSTPLLWSEVLEVINQRRAQGMQIPDDSLGMVTLARQVVSELVDEEILVQKARSDTSIVVADADVATTVEQQMKRLRENFKSDQEYVQALKSGGFGNQEEYRRWLTEQARRRALSQRLIQHLQQSGKMISAAVSEAEITEAFEKNRLQLPKRPATLTFRQIVIATAATPNAKEAARVKAESLLAEINRGGDFASIAKRESQDPGSREQGGDLGWNRRGVMVPAFDQMMFALNPGQVSPVVETAYGFHIIKVDRVKPSEVKARHILIKPALDSADAQRAEHLADSLLVAWKAGASYDTLVARFHDADELPGSLDPFPRDQLPESYKEGMKSAKSGDFFGPFPIEDKLRGLPKYVIGQVLVAQDEGDYTVKDLREQIREQLQQEKSFRRLIDSLKKEIYVSIRLDSLPAASP